MKNQQSRRMFFRSAAGKGVAGLSAALLASRVSAEPPIRLPEEHTALEVICWCESCGDEFEVEVSSDGSFTGGEVYKYMLKADTDEIKLEFLGRCPPCRESPAADSSENGADVVYVLSELPFSLLDAFVTVQQEYEAMDRQEQE